MAAECSGGQEAGSSAENKECFEEMSESLSSISTNTGNECFNSTNHSEYMGKRMELYFQKRQLCDVTLIAGEKRIRAHRLVLSAASDYFSAMFTSSVLEATQEEVVMQNMNGDALYTLVTYCYTGSLELTEDSVEVLLVTAQQILLSEVVEVCCNFLKKQLHPANSLGIQLFADTQGCGYLHKVAQGYTAEHFKEVIQNQEFLQLPFSEISFLLSSDDLKVPSEEIIFHALLLWLKFDFESRKEYMSRLLSLVRLPLLSPQFITDQIESNPMFKDDKKCQELILEALKYHLLLERRLSLQSDRTKPRKATVGSLYVVGGMDSNKGSTSVDKYDLRTNSWGSVATMTGRRLQFGVAVIDTKLYLVGGRDGLKTLNTVECFDPKSNLWSQLPPMATHRHGLGVGVLSGPLYAVGGHDGWSYLNTVERWDPQTRQWNNVAPMSCARSTVGVAVLNGKLYAIGGRDGSSFLRSVECYDPHTNKWTLCSPMARRRGGVGVGVLNGFIYAIGGLDAPASNPSSSRFNCVERYDPATDMWTHVSPLETGCDSAGVAALGDRLFCVGGYDGQVYLDTVQAYDPLINEWTKMTPLSFGRSGACIVVVKNDY